MYDRALNFLLFKVVFVGAILEPRWEELLIWTAWFTILGFLRVFSMLCRDRFEYVRAPRTCLCKTHRERICASALVAQSRKPHTYPPFTDFSLDYCVTKCPCQGPCQDSHHARHDPHFEHYLVRTMHFGLPIHAAAAVL